MNSATTNPRTQEARTEEARARLRESALHLFATKGFEATSLADISVHAGYSRALAQYHFGTKNALAADVLETIGAADMQLSLLPEGDLISGQQAFALLENHCQSAWANLRRLHHDGEHGEAVRAEMALRAAAMFSPDLALRESFAKMGRKLTRRVAHTIGICQRDSIIRADVNPGAAATFYVMSVWGLLCALHVDPGAAERVDQSFAMLEEFLRSLRERGSTS